MFGKAYVDKVYLCCCVLVQVAVHCHAGLGRTGVLMACYLVYYLRVRSNDALRYVRLKRPNAVQTRKQIDCVKEFEAFFLPQCVIFRYTVTFRSVSLTSRSSQGALHFSNRTSGDKKSAPFTIEQHLKRHAFEGASSITPEQLSGHAPGVV